MGLLIGKLCGLNSLVEMSDSDSDSDTNCDVCRKLTGALSFLPLALPPLAFYAFGFIV